MHVRACACSVGRVCMTYWHGVQVAFADPVNACVLWRIELDLVRGCNHVNLVTATHVEV